MAIVCSSCDHVPAADANAGSPCSRCGERLITVDTDEDLTGKNIDGRFHVKARLGNGAMGVVYRAIQLSIGREVALKVLDRRIERDVAAVKRFFREAKLASALAHPNTVPIIDFGQNQDGRLYLVMELVRGKTLLDEINQCGALPLTRVIAIGVQLCEALEVAHGLSIVHRDLKLDNVMLLDGRRDHIKVLDFGLARSLTDTAMNATATGMISGTPRYMPPEVALEGAAPNPSGDMYAVGVMLAELSIGKALWVAPTFEALFVQKLESRHALDGVPAVLRPLVERLLQRNPAARPDAPATRAALRAIDPSRTAGAKSVLSLDLEGEPAHELLELAEPHPATAFPGLSAASLVSLDELSAPPTPATPIAASVPAPFEPAAPSPPAAEPKPRVSPRLELQFVPPPDSESAPLELEAGWSKQRIDKQRAAVPSPIAKRGNAGVLVALLLIALIGGGAVFAYQYTKSSPDRLPGGGVSIRITAGGPVSPSHEVSIDGQKAGKTPFSFKLPKGTKPILITSPGLGPRQIVPDHDQTVDLLQP